MKHNASGAHRRHEPALGFCLLAPDQPFPVALPCLFDKGCHIAASFISQALPNCPFDMIIMAI
jgi:hypothetical protein